MAKPTKSERLIAALLARGAIPVTPGKRKRDTFDMCGQRYHVGKNGALRRGFTVTGSVSLTGGQLWRELLGEPTTGRS